MRYNPTSARLAEGFPKNRLVFLRLPVQGSRINDAHTSGYHTKILKPEQGIQSRYSKQVSFNKLFPIISPQRGSTRSVGSVGPGECRRSYAREVDWFRLGCLVLFTERDISRCTERSA